LCRCQEQRPFFLRSLPISDVADVALYNLMSILFIHVADKLHIPKLSVCGLQRQVFVTEVACSLQLFERLLARLLVTEETDFPKLLSQELGV
jgi:hypothetical protein